MPLILDELEADVHAPLVRRLRRIGEAVDPVEEDHRHDVLPRRNLIEGVVASLHEDGRAFGLPCGHDEDF